MLFGCIYRSPTPSTTSDKNNDDLNRLLLNISKKNYSHECILGDFVIVKILIGYRGPRSTTRRAKNRVSLKLSGTVTSINIIWRIPVAVVMMNLHLLI